MQVEGVILSIQETGDELEIELSGLDGSNIMVYYRYGTTRALTLDEQRVAIAKGIYTSGTVQASNFRYALTSPTSDGAPPLRCQT